MKNKFLVSAVIIISAMGTQCAYTQTRTTDSGYYVNPCDETIFIRRNNIEPGAETNYSNNIDVRAKKISINNFME